MSRGGWTRVDANIKRFDNYVSVIAQELGHADRVDPFRDYCRGLLLPGERKSVEPMAARLEPQRTRSKHQRLHHFVADAPWSDEAVLAAVRTHVLEHMDIGVDASKILIVDDVVFPKQGNHSVGVARQYCRHAGKLCNCQVAVSLWAANETYSLPVAYRLYLPRVWAKDISRRRAAKVPDEIRFASKHAIATALIKTVRVRCLPEIVVADAGYGTNAAFRDRLTQLGLTYILGIVARVSVWPKDSGPLPALRQSGKGRLPVGLGPPAGRRPLQAKELAIRLAARAFRTVTWREGTKRTRSSRFAAVRVRCAKGDNWRRGQRSEQWLLIEWRKRDPEPANYFLSTLPADTKLSELVRIAKLPWRIERDYQELMQELGLGHFEGRSWRGFHHHATLCIAAFGFLITERFPVLKKRVTHSLFEKVSFFPYGSGPPDSPVRPES